MVDFLNAHFIVSAFLVLTLPIQLLVIAEGIGTAYRKRWPEKFGE